MPRRMPMRALHELNDETRRRRRSGQRNHREEPTLCCCPTNSRFATLKCKPHLQFTVISTLQCVILICFVIYDLINITRFKQRYHDYARADADNNQLSDTTREEYDGYSPEKLGRQFAAYRKQQAMAIALLLLLVILISASLLVYVGYVKKQSLLLLPFLILTFPILTFTMIYAILFRVDGAGTIVYVKIITVIIIYTILANIYRAVYRLYRYIKYGNRRQNDPTHSDPFSVSHGVEPVVVRMKPPPYEKEPPPYSITAPDISVPPYHAEIQEGENCSSGSHSPPYTLPSSQSLPQFSSSGCFHTETEVSDTVGLPNSSVFNGHALSHPNIQPPTYSAVVRDSSTEVPTNSVFRTTSSDNSTSSAINYAFSTSPTDIPILVGTNAPPLLTADRYIPIQHVQANDKLSVSPPEDLACFRLQRENTELSSSISVISETMENDTLVDNSVMTSNSSLTKSGGNTTSHDNTKTIV